MNKKLRIALIINENKYHAWQHAIVNKIIEEDLAKITLQIAYNKIVEQNKTTPLLWRLYQKLDSKFFQPKPYALSFVSRKPDFETESSIRYQETSDYNDIDTNNVDVILNLTNCPELKLNITGVKYGMWFITPCDLNDINRRPYGIWELLNKKSENIAVLRCLKEDSNNPTTIATTSSCSDLVSYRRNINSLMWQASLLMIHNLKLLAKNKTLFEKKMLTNSAIFSDKLTQPEEVFPSNSQVFVFTLKLYYNKLVQLIKSKFYFNQWALIYRNNEDGINPFDFSKYDMILPPKDRFWADPFLLKRNDKFYLFIEELIYKNKLGHLSVMEIDKNGSYSKPETILVKDYHLSYPFIFEDEGELYMIPETSGNNDIQLYQCVEFPLKWELKKVIMQNVIAVDTTIHKINGVYWMFTNQKRQNGAVKHVELYAYSTDDLMSDEWLEHPLNPIVTDIKTSRPAGSIFQKNGRLFRPSQDCSHFYGYGLNIMEITKLSYSEYEEKIYHKIEPKWHKSIISTHTFNSVENMGIGDVKIKRRRFF